MRRSDDQVLLSGAEETFGACCGAAWLSQSPLTLVVTFGGLPAPCETVCVVRVQVPLPLLYDTIVVLLLAPAGASPNEAT